jgi:hypothetical protein
MPAENSGEGAVGDVPDADPQPAATMARPQTAALNA